MIGSKEPRAWELCAGQSVPMWWAMGALWSIVAPFGSSGEPKVGPNPYKRLSIVLFRGCHKCISDRGSSRGQIPVKNRKGLERAAGKAYGVPEAEYRRLIG